MKFDRAAILALSQKQEADRLASFRAGLRNVNTRALQVMAATHRRHLELGTSNAHHAPRLEAIESELAKPARALD